MKNHAFPLLALAVAASLTIPAARAADAPDVSAEITALKSRIAELERKEGENWLTAERTAQIKQIVTDAIADAKTRGPMGDTAVGYNNGFFISSGDSFKLVVGGLVQARYTFGVYDKKGVSSTPNASDPGDANGFELRRARINFSGYAFSKDIIYKLEGEFAGSSSNQGDFQVTDAYIGYNFSDNFKIRAGSYKVPFAKAELITDGYYSFMERPEVLFPFDAVRALGVSLYGDALQNDKKQAIANYEININDGSKSNTMGRDTDTTGALDNRLGFYGRFQWAGAGKVADFLDESDSRQDNSDFIWLVGAAAGYESQNSTNNGFPARQTTANLPGLSTADAAGFLSAQNLNGDLYRATVDWTGKYRGWSFNTAAYFQQANQNPGTFPTTGTQTGTTAGTTVATTGTSTTIPGYGKGDSSFFQAGYYGQIGYMIIPNKLELVGRAGQLLTEGYPNRGEFYSIGANYYFFSKGDYWTRNAARISADVTYSPEVPYTDASSDQIANTQELLYRIQFQVKF